MKGLFSLFMLFATILAASYAYLAPVPLPRPGQSGFPTFPGQGPFNPKPQPYPVSIMFTNIKIIFACG